MHKLFFFANYIQIQHLLKLNNVPSLASEGAIIQIQHLLKLNMGEIGNYLLPVEFKYNTC